MSVSTADDADSAITPSVPPVSRLPNQTTYIKANNEIRAKTKKASRKRVHIYTFNVDPEQLKDVHRLLDQHEERKLMRVTFSDDYNFIVKFMPNPAHDVAAVIWGNSVSTLLVQLTGQPLVVPPGCLPVGTTSFRLGEGMKQPDSGFEPNPNPSGYPSIVLEVGDSESLGALRVDGSLWLEHIAAVKLVILLSIDDPIPAHPNTLKLTVELWRSRPRDRPLRPTTSARVREAYKVWERDWTAGATPMYILLSDIFRDPIPPAYGNHDRILLDTVAWRQAIIDRYA